MMKKTEFLPLLTACAVIGQDNRNGIKWNALKTIAITSVGMGYENFLDDAQSVGAHILINDARNLAF